MKKRLLNWLLVMAQTLALATIAQELGAERPKAPATSSRRIAVVVPRNNPITSIEMSDLERICRREKLKWPGGDSITVYERPTEHPIREQFSKLVLRKHPSEMQEYWLNLKLTRGLEAPKVCQSATLLKRYLERVRGAIGYLYEDEADQSVKVVMLLDIK